jgi:hypothetical protein
MNLDSFIEKKIDSNDLDALFEAFCADAWEDQNQTIREIATTLLNNDPQALMEVVREPFYEYMKKIADGESVDLTNEEPDSYNDEPEYELSVDDNDYRLGSLGILI